jgi:hypothetical protein
MSFMRTFVNPRLCCCLPTCRAPQFTIVFGATDYPVSGGAGINTTQCKFGRVSAPVPSAPSLPPNSTNGAAAANASVSANATSRTPVGRRLLQITGAPQLGTGEMVKWGQWQNCPCCSVQYRNFPSGDYTIQVRLQWLHHPAATS